MHHLNRESKNLRLIHITKLTMIIKDFNFSEEKHTNTLVVPEEDLKFEKLHSIYRVGGVNNNVMPTINENSTMANRNIIREMELTKKKQEQHAKSSSFFSDLDLLFQPYGERHTERQRERAVVYG